ncbi:MAG: hypothetical protein AAGN46_14645, partial [Acidobacteriota bacterium]
VGATGDGQPFVDRVAVSTEAGASGALVLDLPPAGGRLLVSHGAGPLFARRVMGDQPRSRWPDGTVKDGTVHEETGQDETVQTIEPPVVLALDGPARWRIAVEAPSVLEIDLPQRSIASLLTAEGQPTRDIVDFVGRGQTLVLEPGTTHLALRGLASSPLVGSATVRLGTLEALTEGIGAPALLAPGAARWFRVRLDTARRIGVGAAGSDAVESRLRDAAGKVVASGLAIFEELPAGNYLLELRLPADAAATTVQPVAVGLEPPSTGPPADVIDSFRRLASADGVTGR